MPPVLALAFALAALPASSASPPGTIPLSDGRWELKGEGVVVETVEGRETIRIPARGWAYRRDVALQDGTVELDVRVTRRRSFVYLAFRMADDREYEEVYLRPHKSDLPDAVQYAPVYQGQSAWQLHHGPGGTAAATIPAGAWTRVRLVVQGTRAALYVGDLAKPALFVPRLAREPRAGFLALRSFQPPDVKGEEPAARFANVSVRPGVFAADLSALPVPEAPSPGPGVVKAWAVTKALPAAPTEGLPTLPALQGLATVEADPGGLVPLHRHVTVPAGARETAAAARVVVRAASAGVRAFDLGWSDRAVVFLNGEPLFAGEASYSFDRPRREGLVGFDQGRLFLPLKAGDNELVVVVSDGFGGMGLMGRFADPAGLAVEAR